MPTKPVHYNEGGFPPKKIDWNRLIPLIGPASAALAFRALLNIAEGRQVF